MTNFEKIKSMSLDELTSFLDTHAIVDHSPWMEWWDKTYCDKCESIVVKSENTNLGVSSFGDEFECAYCEVHNKCRCFPDLEDTPNIQNIVKMWLKTETD